VHWLLTPKLVVLLGSSFNTTTQHTQPSASFLLDVSFVVKVTEQDQHKSVLHDNYEQRKLWILAIGIKYQWNCTVDDNQGKLYLQWKQVSS